VSIFPTRILLATDGSAEAELAATTAADVAKSTDSELHVLHVGEVPVTYHPERHGYRVAYEEHEKEAQQLLEAQVERIKGTGATVGQAHLRMGRADEEIVDLAQSIGAGLIVMGSRGRGRIRRALMGSVSEEGFDGQRIGLGGPPCPLPGHHCAGVRRKRELPRIPIPRRWMNRRLVRTTKKAGAPLCTPALLF
jgi:nucleotide-binding universal stress UspA family protein